MSLHTMPFGATGTPLDSAPVGVPHVVTAPVQTTPAVRRRLAELGLRPGALVTVRQRTSGSGAILGLADSRVAVSGSVLRQITGTPLPNPAIEEARP